MKKYSLYVIVAVIFLSASIIADAQILLELKHPAPVFSISFAPDGKKLLRQSAA
jgi:hypothetical protein